MTSLEINPLDILPLFIDLVRFFAQLPIDSDDIASTFASLHYEPGATQAKRAKKARKYASFVLSAIFVYICYAIHISLFH